MARERVRELHEGAGASTTPSPETLQEHLEQLIPLDAPRRVESEVWFSLVALARSDERLARRRTEIDDAIWGSVQSAVMVVDEIGRLAPRRDQDLETRRLDALSDGLVIQLTAERPRLSADEARAVLAGHLADLAT